MLRDVVRVLGDIPTGSMVEFIIDYHGAVNGDATNSQLGDIRTSTNGLLTFTAQAPGVAGSTRTCSLIFRSSRPSLVPRWQILAIPQASPWCSPLA